jgi:hypothetical protein
MICMGETQLFTCKNPSCKAIFTTPLKTLNLRENPPNPYFACPCCLTKIDKQMGIVKQLPEDSSQEYLESLEESTKHGPIKEEEKNASCKYHIGFLSERKNKEQIPDDCLVCKDIIPCMLQKMHTE